MEHGIIRPGESERLAAYKTGKVLEEEVEEESNVVAALHWRQWLSTLVKLRLCGG